MVEKIDIFLKAMFLSFVLVMGTHCGTAPQEGSREEEGTLASSSAISSSTQQPVASQQQPVASQPQQAPRYSPQSTVAIVAAPSTSQQTPAPSSPPPAPTSVTQPPAYSPPPPPAPTAEELCRNNNIDVRIQVNRSTMQYQASYSFTVTGLNNQYQILAVVIPQGQMYASNTISMPLKKTENTVARYGNHQLGGSGTAPEVSITISHGGKYSVAALGFSQNSTSFSCPYR